MQSQVGVDNSNVIHISKKIRKAFEKYTKQRNDKGRGRQVYFDLNII